MTVLLMCQAMFQLVNCAIEVAIFCAWNSKKVHLTCDLLTTYKRSVSWLAHRWILCNMQHSNRHTERQTIPAFAVLGQLVGQSCNWRTTYITDAHKNHASHVHTGIHNACLHSTCTVCEIGQWRRGAGWKAVTWAGYRIRQASNNFVQDH